MYLFCQNCGTYNRDPGDEPGRWKCGACRQGPLVRVSQKPSGPAVSHVERDVAGAAVGAGIGAAVAGAMGAGFGLILVIALLHIFDNDNVRRRPSALRFPPSSRPPQASSLQSKIG